MQLGMERALIGKRLQALAGNKDPSQRAGLLARAAYSTKGTLRQKARDAPLSVRGYVIQLSDDQPDDFRAACSATNRAAAVVMIAAPKQRDHQALRRHLARIERE